MNASAGPASGGLHCAWARLFVGGLVASGVTDVVISPGSRSTPLALAAAATAGLRCHAILDERVAAFFALGQARASGRPSVLVCTSGTAGAHHLPAVIEARLAHLPLILVTADRPWEEYDVAAPQTVDQTRLYGDHVLHQAELGLPDAAPAALAAVQRVAAQAVARACGPTPGPVHVNARFRKPLEPRGDADDDDTGDGRAAPPWVAEVARLVEVGAPRHAAASTGGPATEVVEDLARRCARARRGLLVCGPSPVATAAAWREAAARLCRATGFPLLVEATSQLRFGLTPGAGVRVCGALDLLARAGALDGCDLIVELGAPPTSAGYAAWLAARRPDRVVVAAHGWPDPSNSARLVINASPPLLATALAAQLRPADETDWAQRLAAAEAAAWQALAAAAPGAQAQLDEAEVARRVVASLPAGALLALGNSSPVRDVDRHCPPSALPIDTLHQRGAAGIDGLVAGAAGAARAAHRPTLLLVGDLAFQHDLGGLAVAREAAVPLVLVVVQNHGGRLFERLPLAARVTPADLERLFVMPQSLDVGLLAAAFALPHARVASGGALSLTLAAALARPGCSVVEAEVMPGAATHQDRTTQEEVTHAIRRTL